MFPAALLLTTAIIETGAGIALIALPSTTASLLLGFPLDIPATALARIAGSSLLALALTSAVAAKTPSTRAATGLIAAMTFYNIATGVILLVAVFQWRKTGSATWPAVILHTLMTLWCATCIARARKKSDPT